MDTATFASILLNTTSNTSQDPDDVVECVEVSRYSWTVAGPVIFLLGILGNLLILVVMSSHSMRDSSASTYLRAMAVADIFALISGLIPEWFEITFNAVFKETHPVSCKLEKFTFYTSADSSIWILVIFTVERLFAVCFPFNSKDQCLPPRSKVFVFCVVLLAVAKNMHVFWTRGVTYVTLGDPSSGIDSNCGHGPTAEYQYFEKYIRPWLVLAVVDALPFVIILTANIFIVRGLVQIRNMDQQFRIKPMRQLVQVSSICLSASLCFLVCITPSMVLLIGRPWWSAHKDCTYISAKGLSNLIVYVHHSVNFCLYCLSGSRFRKVLVRIVKAAKDDVPLCLDQRH